MYSPRHRDWRIIVTDHPRREIAADKITTEPERFFHACTGLLATGTRVALVSGSGTCGRCSAVGTPGQFAILPRTRVGAYADVTARSDIAEILELTLSVVKSRLHEGMKELRARVRNMGS